MQESCFEQKHTRERMISVIIPTYNRAEFIEQAIASVLDQTLTSGAICGEIIVVDDGSTDATPEIVQQISKNNHIPIRYLYQENKGASAARNLGITAAQHDMLCFLDSDDRWVPHKLEMQLHAMQRQPQYLISHTREIWYRHGMQVNQKKKHAPPHGEIFQRALRMCVVGMSTVMMQREIFQRYGLFNENMPCCEDYDLWLRVSREEAFLLVDEALTLKDGGRPDQLSALHRLGMDRWRIYSLCLLLENTSLKAEQYDQVVAELERKCRIYGKGCIKHGRPEEGEYYLALPKQQNMQGGAVIPDGKGDIFL
ncbi:MAG: glycosyltransferase family 2 protein [Candidatus Electrothrix sp. AU1_5]|nr:glycosyltransferase family 2 protein [Candidatus Electrothrix gigas]